MGMEGLMESIRRAYSTGAKPIDMGSVVKQAFTQHDELEKYRYAIESVREQEFLKMISVDSEDLVLEQYQLEAKRMYDKFMDENTQLWKEKKRVLSTEDKLKVIRSQQEIQGRLNIFKAKAEQFVKVKDALAQDGGVRYDEWMMKPEMDAFIADPMNNPVPTLKARPVDLVQHLLKSAPKWVPYARENKVEIGKGQYERYMESYRFGIETEDDLRGWVKERLKQDQTAGYAFGSPYWQRDFDGLVEQLKPEMLPYEFERTSISSSYYFGGGGRKGSMGYSNVTDPQLGEAVNITGNLAPFTLNIDGNRKKVVVRTIGEKGILVDYTEVVPDKTKTGLDLRGAEQPAEQAGIQFGVSASKVIQADDGLWYPTLTASRDRIIGKDEAELGQYYDEIEKAIKAGENTNAAAFQRAWNVFKGNVAKGKKAVPSQPKKQIKRGDIKAKAKAAGYSEAEYTEMLKKNNIEIVD